MGGPERLVVTGLLTLEQDVHVIRLDRPLYLPTHINFSIWTRSRQHIKTVIQSETRDMIDAFLAKVDQEN